MGDDEGMPQLRIALAQVNATVGDLSGNASLVVEWTRKAREGGAHLVVFPEMVLLPLSVTRLLNVLTIPPAPFSLMRLLSLRVTDVKLLVTTPWPVFPTMALWSLSVTQQNPPVTPSP